MNERDLPMLRWIAVYSTMIAEQSTEWRTAGNGGVTPKAMSCFQEEARAVADLDAETWEGDFPECCPRCGSPACAIAEADEEDGTVEGLCYTCNFLWDVGATR